MRCTSLQNVIKFFRNYLKGEKKKMNRTFQKVAPIILSILGSSGVVATTILAVKATPKAQKRIKEIKEESLKLNAKPNNLTVIKALAPC